MRTPLLRLHGNRPIPVPLRQRRRARQGGAVDAEHAGCFLPNGEPGGKERRHRHPGTTDAGPLEGVAAYAACPLPVLGRAAADVKGVLITTQTKRNLSSRSGIGGVLSAT